MQVPPQHLAAAAALQTPPVVEGSGLACRGGYSDPLQNTRKYWLLGSVFYNRKGKIGLHCSKPREGRGAWLVASTYVIQDRFFRGGSWQGILESKLVLSGRGVGLGGKAFWRVN